MQNTITAKIVRIGNSQGIRIPKVLIEQLGLRGTVELQVVDGGLQITSKRHPRDGWAEQIAAIAADDDDEPLIPDSIGNRFDDEEWEWPEV